MGTLIEGGNDLAAELVLNKIMNGQVKTSTGQTITTAGRLMASRLNVEGYSAGAYAGAVSSAIGYVEAAQSQMTDLVSQITDLRKTIASITDFSTGSAQVAAADKQYQKLLAEWGGDGTITTGIAESKIGGQSLFGTTPLIVQAGSGVNIEVLGQDLSRESGKAFADIETALVTGISSATKDVVDGKLAKALTTLQGYIAESATSYKQLTNRAAVLNDMVDGFNEAAAGQGIQDTIGASGLLSAMLGGRTTA